MMTSKNIVKSLIMTVTVLVVSLFTAFSVSTVVKDGNIVEFKEIKINGLTVFESNSTDYSFYPTYVYPGEELELAIEYEGVTDDTQVRLRVTLPGYDYDLIEGYTPEFEVINGTYKALKVKIKLPEDLIDDEYPLKVEFLGTENSDYIELPLKVEAPVKKILEVDTEVIPKLLKYSFKCNDCASNKIKVITRLENRGKKTLKHVNVYAYLKEYPEITKTIVYLYHNRDDEFNGQLEPDEVATLEGTIDLSIMPFPLKTGTYHVVVEIRYDYNHQKIVKEEKVEIVNIDDIYNQEEKESEEQEEKPEKIIATSDSVIVKVNNPIMKLEEQKPAEFELTLKNKEESRINLIVDVVAPEGLQVNVDHPKVSLDSLGEENVKIKVYPLQPGVYPVKLVIKNENGQPIIEKSLLVEANYSNLLENILLGVIILLIVLIIVVLIILALKKEGGNGGVEKEKVIIQREKGNNIKVEEDELY
jgi:hypothetical protein